MSVLQYRPDWEAARARLTTWWNGGDIGRPVMQIFAPREEPWEDVPALPEPEGWITNYSTRDYGYRINLALRGFAKTECLGEAVPAVAPGDLAPNCLALFLGCRGHEMPGTVWCEPCIPAPDAARFDYDPANFYWDFCTRAYTEVAAKGKGKFMQAFPDLIEGLDTLAAMRGTEELLEDLLDRPEWVQACLRQITDRYFRYYDVLYDLIRDEVGGSVFWAWAPGRMAKFQCDFSAMISPAMFAEFMGPVLAEMSARVSYCMYHWDGPGALPHHDVLLALPRLTMLQWTPGAGVEPTWDRRWWPLYHKTIEAGKKLLVGVDAVETLRVLKREFGDGLKQMLFTVWVKDRAEGEAMLHAAEC
ncbi:MAG TPA: hypothetical protein PLZ36_14890 [Armatimonadota bacterium]|nr:hypothetical protein [Armatimonadota bacterium]HOS43602.1 hypothetical protein [Armatimonadota bacterium]